MEMVAASKLKRYQDLLGQTRAYAARLERMLKNVAAQTSSLTHPLFEVRDAKKSLVILIASDSGLCGSYNSNLFQATEQFIEETAATISFFSIGKQGLAYLKRRKANVVRDLSVPRPQEIEDCLRSILEFSQKTFLAHETDRVFLIYTDFVSMSTYRPRVSQLLPLEQPETGESQKSNTDYILEPSHERLLEEMLPQYLRCKVEQALKGALVSEQLSRMIAMRQATDNAAEMIDSLTLSRNKARQASITKELIEIVAGSKAQQR